MHSVREEKIIKTILSVKKCADRIYSKANKLFNFENCTVLNELRNLPYNLAMLIFDSNRLGEYTEDGTCYVSEQFALDFTSGKFSMIDIISKYNKYISISDVKNIIKMAYKSNKEIDKFMNKVKSVFGIKMYKSKDFIILSECLFEIIEDLMDYSSNEKLSIYNDFCEARMRTDDFYNKYKSHFVRIE